MEDNNMKRGLNSRHISMIAIGGAIGTVINRRISNFLSGFWFF